jgi:hypothetical protein
VAQEPGVVAMTFADGAPGGRPGASLVADIETSPGAGPAFDFGLRRLGVGPGFFEAFDRPIVAGRAFNGGDWSPAARAVIVNEAFVGRFQLAGGGGLPIGTRLRYSDSSTTSAVEPSGDASADMWFEIVGIVRNSGLDLDDEGDEEPFVFHPASAGTLSPLVISVRVAGDPGTLVARLPIIAADIDARLSVPDARPLTDWQDGQVLEMAGALAGVASLVLFLSALGIYSLLSVSVSRRTREIGLRAALGADPRRVLVSILSRAVVLMLSGIAVGGSVLIFVTAVWEEDVARIAIWLAMTAVVMLASALLASLEPARRALKINPIDALRQT